MRLQRQVPPLRRDDYISFTGTGKVGVAFAGREDHELLGISGNA
jgi:hypothetical protein